MNVEQSQYDGAPNYFPNSFSGPVECPSADLTAYNVSGQACRYNSADDDNFSQVANFWTKVLGPAEKERLTENIARHLKDATPFIQDRAIKNFQLVHPDYASMIKKKLQSGAHHKSTL